MEREAFEAYVQRMAPICEKTRDRMPLCECVAIRVSLAFRDGREWFCITGSVDGQIVQHLHAMAFENGHVWLCGLSRIECNVEVCDIIGIRADTKIRDVLACCLGAVLNSPQ